MFKKNIKKLFFILVATNLLIGNSLTLPISEAKYVPSSRSICNLAVAPYNPTGKTLTNVDDGKYALDKYLNFLSTDTCKKFVKLYGNAYSPQPPKIEENSVTPSAIQDNVNVPVIQHDHAYYNDTAADEYYYKSFVKKFVITMQEDAAKNIDINNIKCDTAAPNGYAMPKSLIDCNGSSDDTLWGGTTVTKNSENDKVIITWTFGNINPKNIPRVWANNGQNFDYGTDSKLIDFSQDSARKLGFNIHLPTKDNGDIWSATTTSKALLGDQAIFRGPNDSTYKNYKDKPCINNNVNNPESGWCYLNPAIAKTTKDFPTEQVVTGSPHTFYWFPIGSVATVWQKFAAPENICTELKASLGSKTIKINGKDAYPVNVDSVTFAPVNKVPTDVKYDWSSTDPKGKFFILSPLAGSEEMASPYVDIAVNNNVTYKQQAYYIGTGTINVKLTGIDEKLANPAVCQKSFTIEVPECKELLVDHQEHIYEGTYSTFKAKSLDTDYKELDAKVEYSIDPEYGEFYLIKPTNYDSKKNNSKMIFEATPTSQSMPYPGNTSILPDPKIDFKINPKILIYGNNLNDAAISFTDINLKIAAGKFGIQDLSQNITDLEKLSNAVSKKFLILPDWMTSGLPTNTNPTDPFMNPLSDQTYDSNPGKFGLNSVFDIDQNQATTQQSDTQYANPFFKKSFSFLSKIQAKPDEIVYFYAKKAGKGVIHVKTVGSTKGICEKNYDIEAVCAKLNFIGNPVNPIVGQNSSTTLTVNPVDSTGKALPSSTNIKFTTTAGGTFNTLTLSNILAAKVSEFPVFFKSPTTAGGKITATLDPADPLYSSACSGEITTIPAPTSQCTAIQLTLKDAATGATVTQLEKNKKYILSATIDTTPAGADKITYSIDPLYGSFTYMDVSNLPDSIKQGSSMILDEVKAYPLILTTSANTPSTPIGLIQNVLKVQGTGYANTQCATAIPFNNPGECKSITLTPNGTDFDPTNNNPADSNPNDSGTTFLIGGDFSSHPGPIEVKIKSTGVVQGGKPSIKRADNPGQVTEDGTITFTNDDIKKSNNQLSFVYTRNNFGLSKSIQNSLETLDLNIDTIGSSQALCHQYIHKESQGQPPCQGNNCLPKPPTPTSPKFVKFVYPMNKLEKANQEVININRNTEYVTYVLKFTTGNEEINDLKVWDMAIQNGHILQKNQNQFDSSVGYLDFQAMKIDYISGNNKTTLYKTPGSQYQKDNGKNKTDLTTDASDTNKTDIGNYTKCVSGKSEPCINTATNQIESSFKNKTPVSFNHLKPNSTLLVKYQMKYANRQTLNGRCVQKFKSKKSGCGEQFENTAAYQISSKEVVKSKKVKAIAICPYVLTRQGGDTFFHDVIETGIDISQCYEVKSCEGPCITPETPKEQKNVNTGTGDYATPLLLQSPSHDVCSASNKGADEDGSNDIKAYQDVLKNFSSSICELKADVAKAWTKQNITDSINANVKRIARFGSNLNGINSTITSPSQLPQDSNGVFVKTDDDLTIGSGINGDYKIGSPIDKVPAAQTYIVIGHDLHIKSNIAYDNTTNFIQTFDKKSIPSAAFIVIGGNITIDNDVDHIDGILMAIDIQGKGGEVRSYEDTPTDEKSLNINGNLIGNVLNLFTNRQYAGDPLQDDGSINIHYDERILLNPPPGINELINLQQVVVPN